MRWTSKDQTSLENIIDRCMPGRRVGSVPPEDLRPAAREVLSRLFDRLPAGEYGLGLTSLRRFLAQQGERHDDDFAKSFRREAIAEELRRSVGLESPVEVRESGTNTYTLV